MRKVYLWKPIMALGCILVLSPLFLYWFIHGDYERYIRIISGPFPFSHFGGGPFQLFMYGGLFLTGLVFLLISLVLKKK